MWGWGGYTIEMIGVGVSRVILYDFKEVPTI